MGVENKPEVSAAKSVGKGASGGVKAISAGAVAVAIVGFLRSKGWVYWDESVDVAVVTVITAVLAGALHSGANYVKHKWGVSIPIITGFLILIAPAFVFHGCQTTWGKGHFSIGVDPAQLDAVTTSLNNLAAAQLEYVQEYRYADEMLKEARMELEHAQSMDRREELRRDVEVYAAQIRGLQTNIDATERQINVVEKMHQKAVHKLPNDPTKTDQAEPAP